MVQSFRLKVKSLFGVELISSHCKDSLFLHAMGKEGWGDRGFAGDWRLKADDFSKATL